MPNVTQAIVILQMNVQIHALPHNNQVLMKLIAFVLVMEIVLLVIAQMDFALQTVLPLRLT